MPTSVAAADTCSMPRRSREAGTGLRNEVSFFHWIRRETLMPQVCAPPAWNLSDLNGMTISTIHPCSKTLALASQTVFQSTLTLRSSVTRLSSSPPSGVVMNAMPLRRS